MAYQFEHFFDPETQVVLRWLDQRGLTLFLVGGAVRDYILSQKKSLDLDFEVRFKKSSVDLAELSQHFLQQFSDYQLTVLPYSVYRFDKPDGHSLEISLPRKEEVINPYDHHYFDVEIDSSLSLAESLIRRDFTINALALELVFDDRGEIRFQLHDIFHGLLHLAKKELHFVSDHFSFDPVRFLRAYRFKEVLGFSFSVELENELKKIPLSKLSLFYFLEEWKKTRNVSWGFDVLNVLKNHSSNSLPEWFVFLDRIHLENYFQHQCETVFQQDMLKFWHDLALISVYKTKHEVPFSDWQKYFGLKEREFKSIKHLKSDGVDYLSANFFYGEFGVNNELLENLQSFRRHLDHVSFLQDFIGSYLPDQFVIERALLSFIKEAETEINLLKKNERDQFLPVWRSLWSYYLVGVKHVKK